MSDLVWPKKRCRQEARKYDSLKAFELGCRGAYRAARKRGWLDDVCSHMQRQVNPRHYWTKDRCAAEAAKYNFREEFKANAEAAHSAARKKGWLDEVCAHMEDGRKSLWTYEACEQEALKYETRSGFSLGSGTAYDVARENDWLDDICWFMNSAPRDAIYLIREELPEGERYVVKIGVTTFDRGDYRVRQGHRHFERPVVVTYHRNKSAKRIERMLLRRYPIRPHLLAHQIIDGHTELRMMTAEEINEALQLSRA